MPPSTVTTSARIRIGSPMPTCTAVSGAVIMPAKPASAAPTPNTTVNTRGTSTPSAIAMLRSLAPARTHMPARVCAISRYNAPTTSSPAPSTSRRNAG